MEIRNTQLYFKSTKPEIETRQNYAMLRNMERKLKKKKKNNHEIASSPKRKAYWKAFFMKATSVASSSKEWI